MKIRDSCADDAKHTRYLELLHFAFRNVVREPDEILKARGLNRSHHRILHFVGRQEEVAMLDLLDILGITRQALHGPLRQLIDRGLVEVRPLPKNRRYFALRLTEAGRALEGQVTGIQRDLFASAEAAAGPQAMEGWRKVMTKLAEGTRFDELHAGQDGDA